MHLSGICNESSWSKPDLSVLVVLSDGDETVTATDGDNEFFRFDATRHDKSLERLAKFATNKGVEVSAEALIKSAEQQRNATLMLLAGGLPIYEIDLRGFTPNATLMGTVLYPPGQNLKN